MDEVSGALIAIALVLIGVFLPTSFIPGISGAVLPAVRGHDHDRHGDFGVRVADAVAGHGRAAAASRRRERAAPGWRGLWRRFTGGGFNRGFDRLSDRYGRYTARSLRVLGIVGDRLCAADRPRRLAFWATPTGFIPAQDQGYLIGVVQLPPGASLQRTDAVLRSGAGDRAAQSRDRGDRGFAGFDGATFTNAPNAAAMFVDAEAEERARAMPTRWRTNCAARSPRSRPAICSSSRRRRSAASARAAATR